LIKFKNTYFWIFIVTLIVSIPLYLFVKQWKIKQLPFNEFMLETAKNINEDCPKMIDEHTRLDDVLAIPPNELIYNYTLVNIDMDDVNINNVTPSLEAMLLKTVKENNEFKIFRENRTTITYRYFDKEGLFMVKIDITPEKYLY
jgi:hypothetical protein